jgi:hypothetical protein
MGEMRNAYEVLAETSKKRYRLRDPSEDGKIIFKLMLKE